MYSLGIKGKNVNEIHDTRRAIKAKLTHFGHLASNNHFRFSGLMPGSLLAFSHYTGLQIGVEAVSGEDPGGPEKPTSRFHLGSSPNLGEYGPLPVP
jgi:hypothetical protein